MTEVTIVKSEEEIEFLRTAAKTVDEVMESVVSECKAGMTELQLASRVNHWLEELGYDPVIPKNIIIGAGPNAKPGHAPADRKIKEREFVIIDIFGTGPKGYCFDITRTPFVGKPDHEMQKIYSVVQEAQEEAFRSVAPSIPARNVDQVARHKITEHGFEKYFTHRTGHGMGLEVHEHPYIDEKILSPFDPE